MRFFIVIVVLSMLTGCKKPVEACFEFTESESNVFKFYFNSDCSEGAVAYDWEFGDGTTSIAASPSNTYQQPGEYPVTLRITSEKGEMSTITHWLAIDYHCVKCSCYIAGDLLYEDEACGNSAYVQEWCESCLSAGSPFDCTCD